MLKRLLKFLYRLPILSVFLGRFLTAEEKRLHTRHAIKKLADVDFLISCGAIKNHRFYLKDISLGGLAFVLDANDQVGVFSSGSIATATLVFRDQKFTGSFRIAYTRNGMTGCQILANKAEYRRFVAEKMGDLLVKSHELN